MKLKILSEKFYNTYADCNEILKKEDRPYACLTYRTGWKTIYELWLQKYSEDKYISISNPYHIPENQPFPTPQYLTVL